VELGVRQDLDRSLLSGLHQVNEPRGIGRVVELGSTARGNPRRAIRGDREHGPEGPVARGVPMARITNTGLIISAQSAAGTQKLAVEAVDSRLEKGVK
jgi:hypothetical protein